MSPSSVPQWPSREQFETLTERVEQIAVDPTTIPGEILAGAQTAAAAINALLPEAQETLTNLNGVRAVVVQDDSVTLASTVPAQLQDTTYTLPGGGTVATVTLDVPLLGQAQVPRMEAVAEILGQAQQAVADTEQSAAEQAGLNTATRNAAEVARLAMLATGGTPAANISGTTANPPIAPNGERGLKLNAAGDLQMLVSNGTAWSPLGAPLLGVGGLAARHGVSILDYGAVKYDAAVPATFDEVARTANVQAFALAEATAKILGGVVRAQGTYATNATVNVNWHLDARACTLICPNTITAIQVGTVGAALFSMTIDLPEVLATKTGAGWAGGGTGYRLVNTYSCTIYLTRARNFAVGTMNTAFGRGNCYNVIEIGHMENNRENFVCEQGDATSWVNDNLYLGGRMSHYSGEGTAVAGVRQIKISPRVGGNGPANNNKFIGMSIEGNTAAVHVEICGPYNLLLALRWEADTPTLLFRTADGGDNIVDGGYGTWRITATETEGAGRNSIRATRWEKKAGTQFLKNATSSASPTLRGYESGKPILEAADADTDWAWQFTAQGVKGKRAGDAFPRVYIEWLNSKISVGNGTAEPTAYIASFGALDATFGGREWYFPSGWDTAKLRMGTLRLFQDTAGRLRMHNAVPTAETNGAAVVTTATVATTVEAGSVRRAAALTAAAVPSTALTMSATYTQSEIQAIVARQEAMRVRMADLEAKLLAAGITS